MTKYNAARVPQARVTRFAPGEEAQPLPPPLKVALAGIDASGRPIRWGEPLGVAGTADAGAEAPTLPEIRLDTLTAPSVGYLPGDFILTHGDSFYSKLIRFGQRLRFHGKNAGFAHWNHAAMIVGEDGSIIEALGRGVLRRNLSNYKGTEYHLVHFGHDIASDDDREQVVKFAEWTMGQEYGWVTIVSIALSLLSGLNFSFGFDGQSICSGLVARALERTNVIFDRSPSHIMPADLARYFGVNADEPLSVP